MKAIINESSGSLITDLCKEIELIRQRGKSIIRSLHLSKNNELRKMLIKELEAMNNRRVEIERIMIEIKDKGITDSISVNFLMELCHRALYIDGISYIK